MTTIILTYVLFLKRTCGSANVMMRSISLYRLHSEATRRFTYVNAWVCFYVSLREMYELKRNLVHPPL